MVTITQLRTDRLLLRQWRDDDLLPWAALNADPMVREFLGPALTYEQSAQSMELFRAELAARGWGWWALEVPATGEFIGFAGLDPTDESSPVPGVEIGWRLARGAWGHGYATEAAHALLDFGFAELGLGEILAITVATNRRSRDVMHRLGMTHDPACDFEDPEIPAGPLRHHVLYRIARPPAVL
ncbi:GNAT family N-acetyltransferase [Actinoplanes sp. RD1]|uniref:GNAT family N-acetyltransferase n=1 Tax=Actinoplanes sp. RD1 TaxID=3064538 RepID=UPI002741DFE9|nr:GNAT family N-acetyltransferase [Actinoplanes sp. RD1]